MKERISRDKNADQRENEKIESQTVKWQQWFSPFLKIQL